MAYREDVSTLKLNDTKNTFISPMTSTGKIREKSMESFIVGLRTVQTLKANL